MFLKINLNSCQFTDNEILQLLANRLGIRQDSYSKRGKLYYDDYYDITHSIETTDQLMKNYELYKQLETVLGESV